MKKTSGEKALENNMPAFEGRKGDTVAPDQGGRMTEFDPAGTTKEKVRRQAYELYEQPRKVLLIPTGWLPKLRY